MLCWLLLGRVLFLLLESLQVLLVNYVFFEEDLSISERLLGLKHDIDDLLFLILRQSYFVMALLLPEVQDGSLRFVRCLDGDDLLS